MEIATNEPIVLKLSARDARILREVIARAPGPDGIEEMLVMREIHATLAGWDR